MNQKERIVYLFVWSFLWICSFIPRKVLLFIGKSIGYIIFRIYHKRRGIALQNVSRSFPENSEGVNHNIVRESFQNLGILFVELIQLLRWNNDQIRSIVVFENTDIVYRARAMNKPIMFISGHFGNWELLAVAAPLWLDIPLNVIAKVQHNAVSNAIFERLRIKTGNKILVMEKAARQIVGLLRTSSVVALLADQGASESSDVFVDFFGRPASTHEAPAALALKFRPMIITGFAVRQPDNSYRVILRELNYDDLDDSRESVKELTQRHVRVLEDVIRQNPGQWSWQHRRWKHVEEYEE